MDDSDLCGGSVDSRRNAVFDTAYPGPWNSSFASVSVFPPIYCGKCIHAAGYLEYDFHDRHDTADRRSTGHLFCDLSCGVCPSPVQAGPCNPHYDGDAGGNPLHYLWPFWILGICAVYGMELFTAGRCADAGNHGASHNHWENPIYILGRPPLHPCKKIPNPDFPHSRNPVCKKKETNQKDRSHGKTGAQKKHSLHTPLPNL